MNNNKFIIIIIIISVFKMRVKIFGVKIFRVNVGGEIVCYLVKVKSIVLYFKNK